MAIKPNSFEFNLFFILTIIVLAAKGLLTLYLGKKVLNKKKETGHFSIDFLFSVMILILCLFISRLFYTYFDFFLTKFDESTYHMFPNVVYWKIAGFIAAMGFAFVLFIIDLKVLNFKYKGLFCYILILLSLIQLLFPVNSAADFELVSSLTLFLLGIGFIFPAVFIYIGIKTPGLRKISFMIVLGCIIYTIGGIIVGEYILAPLREIFGPQIHITAFFIFLFSKLTGLTLLAYSVSKFSL